MFNVQHRQELNCLYAVCHEDCDCNSRKGRTALSWSVQGANMPLSNSCGINDALGKAPKQRLFWRQTLSCFRCRKRKVKCDRTKPCSACCASGCPSECHFFVSDGSDFAPIQQSYEIRELRLENKKLREQLLDTCVHQMEQNGHQSTSDKLDMITKCSTYTPSIERQRLVVKHASERTSKGSVSLVELLDLTFTYESSTIFSSTPVLYQIQGTTYPFPMVESGENNTAALTHLLPHRDRVLEDLEAFQRLSQTFTVHQPPDRMRARSMNEFLHNIGESAIEAPDVLALLFAVSGLVSQSRVTDRVSRHTEEEIKMSSARSECYIAASMQALRNANFMNEPTLPAIKTLLVIELYLINRARMQDAWTLFGLTIRLAYLLNLHHDPEYLDHDLSAHEKSVRRSLWWLMLYSDQYLSIALARPLGISNNGDCPPPIFSTSSPEERRLHQIVNEFTVVSRQILSSEGKLENIAAHTQKLSQLWETVPEILRFKEAWVQTESSRPSSPLDVIAIVIFSRIQLLIVLLNCQPIPWLKRSTSFSTPQNHAELPLNFGDSNFSHFHDDYPRESSCWETERRHVVRGCVQLLRAFHYLWQRRSATRICQVLDHEAYYAAMVLIHVLRVGRNQKCIQIIEKTRLVFVEMGHDGTNELAGLAVRRIDEGLTQLYCTRGMTK